MSDGAQELARQVGVPYVCLSDAAPTAAALAIVPLSLARRCRALPLATEDGTLTVAMADPCDGEALHVLAATANMRIFPVASSPSEIAAALDAWERRTPTPAAERPGELLPALCIRRRARRHVRR